MTYNHDLPPEPQFPAETPREKMVKAIRDAADVEQMAQLLRDAFLGDPTMTVWDEGTPEVKTRWRRVAEAALAVRGTPIPGPPCPECLAHHHQDWRPPCRDCGPGYRRGDDGCRHNGYQPTLGEKGVCRTCARPIWWEPGKVDHREVVGWSDRIERGGDSVVCFSAIGYRHVPMGDREAAIYQAGFNAGQEAER